MASGSDYKLGEKLGEGAFGTVYKATRTCALKSIDIGSLLGREKVAKKAEWKQEVNALMLVRGHDNIVEYRNSFASVDDKLWVEMECCNGGTLNDYVLYKKPGRDVKHRFMVEISSGIAFLHKKGVVHRDLKPENIMISIDEDNSPHAKVADFGLAKVIASCHHEGEMLQYYLKSGCGTEYFIAPEVYDGHYTEKADVFSMWVIFYAMVPMVYGLKIGNKHYLIGCWTELNGQYTPIGRYMHETGNNMIISDTDAEQMSAKAVSLLNSMSNYNYAHRPSAAQVNATLRSLSPKEFSMLAQPPSAAASP